MDQKRVTTRTMKIDEARNVLDVKPGATPEEIEAVS